MSKFDSPELPEPTFAAAEFWFVADPLGGLRTLSLREWPGAATVLPSRSDKREKSASAEAVDLITEARTRARGR